MARRARPPQDVADANAAIGGKSLLWLQGLLCGVLAALATPTAVLLGVLLAPGLVSILLDRSPGRPIARTLLLFGLSTTVNPLAALWRAGHTMEVAGNLAFDPGTLAWSWAAAATGWLLTQILPMLVRLMLESAALSRRIRLKLLRTRYAEAWELPTPRGDDKPAA